jgi:hypothetical protein
MLRATFSLAITALATIALAAPGPKDKETPLGPIKPEQRKKSVENLKEIGLAFHNFHDANGFLPTNQVGKDKKPLLSWRVQILPYVEQVDLYKQFKLDEPWDSEHNKKLIEKMPAIYLPVRGRAKAGETFYQGFCGSHGMLKSGEQVGLATIPDGTSNTLMVVEAGKPVIWTKPEDMPFEGKDVPLLGGMFDGAFTAVMGDGSARRFKKGIAPDLLKRLIDPADGMVVNVNELVEDDDE